MMKVALFAFQGEPMCFVHVLLTAMDLHERGHDVRIVLEGAATALVKSLAVSGQPFSGLYRKVREAGLLDCACKACSAKMEVIDSMEEQQIVLADEMSGHPSMARYLESGFKIITF